jgi:hypothetical protein
MKTVIAGSSSQRLHACGPSAFDLPELGRACGGGLQHVVNIYTREPPSRHQGHDEFCAKFAFVRDFPGTSGTP